MQKVPFDKILFLDIETVPQFYQFDELPDEGKKLYDAKTKMLQKEKSVEEVYDRAGIYAEFGKIVCISVGFLQIKQGEPMVFRTKSFANKDEQKLLQDFSTMLDQFYGNPSNSYICGHNIKEFDIPYTCRRMLINGVALPNLHRML